jgi:hypothetical protein
MIHIVVPKDTTPGQTGYEAFVRSEGNAMDQQALRWIALIQPDRKGTSPAFSTKLLPLAGTIFRLEMIRKPKKVETRPSQPIPPK